MTAARTRLAALGLVTGTVATALVSVAVPAQAAVATRTQCSAGPASSTVCVGVQTDAGAVRGYASVADPAGGPNTAVTVRSLVLQRRVCGGAWQTWTSTRTTGDTSTTKDTDVTQWVAFPRGVQFRSVMSYSVEDVSPPSLGRAGSATSRAYGAC